MLRPPLNMSDIQKNPKISNQPVQKRILIVDDDDSFLDFLFIILRKHFEVITAHNGESALKTFRRENPDLLITDIVMPRLDGFMLITEIRRMTDKPILAISGGNSEQSRQLTEEVGANDFLSKPFRPEVLIDKVWELIQSYENQQANRHKAV